MLNNHKSIKTLKFIVITMSVIYMLNFNSIKNLKFSWIAGKYEVIKNNNLLIFDDCLGIDDF